DRPRDGAEKFPWLLVGIFGGSFLLLTVVGIVVAVLVSGGSEPSADGGLPGGDMRPPLDGGRPPLKAGTNIMGGGPDDPTFKVVAPDGGMLIGFDVGVGGFVGTDVVRTIQPIFRTAKGEIRGQQYGMNFERMITVRAKDGYAVGAITAKAGLLVDGFSV